MKRLILNNQSFIRLFFCSAFVVIGCNKESSVSRKLTQSEEVTALNKSVGATQISGVGYFATNDECNSISQGADFAVRMTGGLEGCLYTFVDDFECSPSGTYREVGREYFVGTYNGESGTFRTTYRFEAKFEGCAANGSYLGSEIIGRCQHPIVVGSGTGIFNGVTGRLDLKDDIQAGNYPYTAHLLF